MNNLEEGIYKCTCNTDKEFKGNSVKTKIEKGLTKIVYGSNFGEILYKCNFCGQLWEENLSQATYHDWPPILIKISHKEVNRKYGSVI